MDTENNKTKTSVFVKDAESLLSFPVVHVFFLGESHRCASQAIVHLQVCPETIELAGHWESSKEDLRLDRSTNVAISNLIKATRASGVVIRDDIVFGHPPTDPIYGIMH